MSSAKHVTINRLFSARTGDETQQIYIGSAAAAAEAAGTAATGGIGSIPQDLIIV